MSSQPPTLSPDMSSVDWANPKAQLTPHFTVHDALYLPSWKVYHQPSEAEKAAILDLAARLELVREFLEKPMIIHCWIRPVAVKAPGSFYHYKNYNGAVSGAPNSSHVEGKAVDFHCPKTTCAELKFLLKPELERFKLRMENDERARVHLDSREPLQGHPRFFRP